jgi:hypothetical protein
MSSFTEEQIEELKDIIRCVIETDLGISLTTDRDYYTDSIVAKLFLKGGWDRKTISSDSITVSSGS